MNCAEKKKSMSYVLVIYFCIWYWNKLTAPEFRKQHDICKLPWRGELTHVILTRLFNPEEWKVKVLLLFGILS